MDEISKFSVEALPKPLSDGFGWVDWTYTAAGSKSVLAASFLKDEENLIGAEKFYVCSPPWLLRYCIIVGNRC